MSTPNIAAAQAALGVAYRALKEQRQTHLSHYQPDATAKQRVRYTQILDRAMRHALRSMSELDKFL